MTEPQYAVLECPECGEQYIISAPTDSPSETATLFSDGFFIEIIPTKKEHGLLIKAELFRQTGKFKDALEILNNTTSVHAKQIVEKAATKNSDTFKINPI